MTIRHWVCVVFAGALGGCSYYDFFSTPGGVAQPPTGSEITAIVNDAKNTGLSPAQYLLASLTSTDEKCERFFNLLERFKEDNSLLDQVVTAAVAAATPLATDYAIRNVITPINIAALANRSSAQIYAFSDYTKGLRSQIKGLMASYRSTHGIDTITSAKFAGDQFGFSLPLTTADAAIVCPNGGERVGVPNGASPPGTVAVCLSRKIATSVNDAGYIDSMLVMRMISANYASLCSLAQMKEIVVAAINATETKDKSPSGTSPTAPPVPSTGVKTTGTSG